MQQPPLCSTHSIPHLAVFDPSGTPILPQQAESRIDDGARPRGISQPMYRCGSTLCIVSGEDVFPLPKEMDIPDMEDLWEMFSYEQVPTNQWPQRLTAQPHDDDIEMDNKGDKSIEDDGDLRPMETLQVHPQIMPPTPKKPSLLLDVSEEDMDMSEYIQQQDSVTSIVLGERSEDLEEASDISRHNPLSTHTSDSPSSQASPTESASSFETYASQTDYASSPDQLSQIATKPSDNEPTSGPQQSTSVQSTSGSPTLSPSSTEASLSPSNDHSSQSTNTYPSQAIGSPAANGDGTTPEPLGDGADIQIEPSPGMYHSIFDKGVPELKTADLADLPPLSPDDDASMLGDISIETVDAEVTYYNGIPSLDVPKALPLVRSGEDWDETEEDEEDEDEPLIPRLLTYESSGSKSLKMPRPDYPSEATGSSNKAAKDPFQPAAQLKSKTPAPKTPRRAFKSQIPHIRGSTEPPRLPAPHRAGCPYEEPRPLTRPFFPCEVSDLRRAGSDDTPSKPLYLLAGVASDANWDKEIGDTPGQNSQDTPHTPWSSFASTTKNQDEGCPAGSALISAPSPSEMIWQKGHVAKPKMISTPVSSKRKGTFIPPAPLLNGRTPETIRTVIPQPQKASQASARTSARRSTVGREQSIDSVTTHGASPRKKRIIQLVGPSVIAAIPLQHAHVDHFALRPTRQAAVPELRQPTPETVTPRKVSDERSPSPLEQDTLGSIQQIDFDDPMVESIETVTSTDSGLMGRQSSLTPAPPSTPHSMRGSASGRGRGGGRGRRRGRGGGRRGGNKRAATAAPRIPSLVIAAAASVKRNADKDEMTGPPSKRLKSITGRSKTSGSKPSRPIAQSTPTPAMDVNAEEEDELESPPRFRSQTRASRSSRAHSAVPAIDPAATPEPSQSPDPIGHTPQADDVEVKEEALEEFREVKAHRRAYTDEEHSMILQLLGPDRGEGFMRKSKLEDICKKLHEFGFMQRTSGAMKTKIRELLSLNKKR